MTTIPVLDPTTDLETLLDPFEGLPCQDPRHPSGKSRHDPSQGAEFVLLNPCCGDRALICRSRARYLYYESAQIRCNSCSREWPPSAYRFIPINPNAEPL